MEFHQIDYILAMMAKYACMDIKQSVITTRKRSCGKVMFSQVSVCPQGVGICSLMLFQMEGDISGTRSFPEVGGVSGGWTWN